MESDWGLTGRVYGRRVDLGFRRYAIRTARLRGSEYIVRLLVFVGRSTSLLLCLLDASKHKLVRLWSRHKSKIFGSFVVPLHLRNGFLRFRGYPQQRGRSRRTAVGLKPLGSTSNDW